jgi:hypothetical protein
LIAALVVGQLSLVMVGGEEPVSAAGEGTISGVVTTDGVSALPEPYTGGGAQPVPAVVTVVE